MTNTVIKVVIVQEVFDLIYAANQFSFTVYDQIWFQKLSNVISRHNAISLRFYFIIDMKI